jgi:DNA polymerase-3 subunit alpha/error-prone DNA polymerase
VGLSRLALTDLNGMHGLPTFVEACRKAGISPITGVEFVDSAGRLVLIARTPAGYFFLTKTLTRMANPGSSVDVSGALARRREEKGARKPSSSTVTMDALREYRPEYDRDLFVLSDDLEALLRLKESSPQESCGWLFCLATPCNKARWAGLAATGLPAAASPEVRFLEPRQREVQRLLLAIGKKAGYGDIREEELDPESSLWSEEALWISGGARIGGARIGGARIGGARIGGGDTRGGARHPWAAPPALESWLAGAAANNRRIAELSLGDPFSGFHFPAYQGDLLSGGEAPTGDPGQAQVSPQAQDPAELLSALVREGAMRRYSHCGGEVAKRIDYEMSLIASKGFCGYFLIVRDIVRRASRVCGRGSAAASIVSYCLGITEVDPLRHDLYFDRFLNPGRKDPPDIDIDFAWDERDGILEALVKAYGPDRVARVANHNCFRDRSALRETARAFGMPDQEISAFERSLRIDQEGALAQADPAWRRILDLATRIVDFPRHLGAHSGGIVIVPEDIARYAPIEETGTGIRVLAWDKEGAEQAGLVKIDLLGNRSLAVVRDAADSIRAQGIALDAALGNPLDDPATIALLSRGDSMGVFYVESPAMRLLQKKTGRGDFGHLVIHSSIIRPAANAYINEYIDRLKGKPWKPLHPLLEGLFDETYGILCYQEDVSKAAMALAGFSSTQADGLRKILAKKDADARLQEHWPAFSRGAAARGVDPETTQAVWDMMKSFSGYSFVKAHSASYAMLSFQSAYLRAHYPAAFMAAVMSNHGGFYSPLAYASEARRMGLRLLSPDVNESQWRCQGQGRTIRFGFCMVSSLSAAVAHVLLEERRARGPFSSVDQFARRVNFERSDAEALVGCGAFDSLLVPPGAGMRAQALMTLLSVCAFKEDRARFAGCQGAELFPEEGFSAAGALCRAGTACDSPPRRLEPPSQRKRRQAEFKYLGTTLDCHPLELWPRLFGQDRLRALDLDRHIGRRVRLLSWPITAKPVLTASDEPMEFVSFEDETAIYEAVLFPEAYRKFRHLLFEEGPLWVEGLVERDRGATTLTIESIKKGE